MITQILRPRNVFFHSFYIFCILGIISMTILSCDTKKLSKTTQELNSSIKFSIENSAGIDNIIFTKFGGFLQEDIKPFQKNMKIIMNEPINNFYQLILQKGDKNLIAQLWLKGEDIEIEAQIVDHNIQIDTVINSPFYYYTRDILSSYSATNNSTRSYEEINNSLIAEIKSNIDNPFSQELASIYISRNVNEQDNLTLLNQVLSPQNEEIKNHILSVHQNLANIIATETLELETFRFNNEDGQESKISINDNDIYMLDFWFTGCAPCITDHVTIDSMMTFFKEAQVEIIGISTDYDPSDWMDYVDKKKLKWNNYIELVEENKILSKHLGISSFPTYIIINGSGKILNRSNSLKESIAFIEENY